MLNNSIGPNIGKLPDNVVVVAAGNSIAESEAAYNMPEPLFRRFEGHIYLEPNVKEFIEWGSEEISAGRNKIHPLISNFIACYGVKTLYQAYDPDNPPKHVIDPRAWEQVSDIIYDNDGELAKELISNKVGEELATSLIAFAEMPMIGLEDVLNDNYEANDIPQEADRKYALAISLRIASNEEVGKVREKNLIQVPTRYKLPSFLLSVE